MTDPNQDSQRARRAVSFRDRKLLAYADSRAASQFGGNLSGYISYLIDREQQGLTPDRSEPLANPTELVVGNLRVRITDVRDIAQ